MRIAQVAPIAESVPPKLYGGTERVVSWLTEELAALGHDVTLFASGDSSRKASSFQPSHARSASAGRGQIPFPSYAAHLGAVAAAASTFDIIHCHTEWVHLPLLTQLKVPHLTTLHSRLDTPDLKTVIARFPQAPLISISHHQRSPLPSANWLGTVYHGMPPASLSASAKPGS